MKLRKLLLPVLSLSLLFPALSSVSAADMTSKATSIWLKAGSKTVKINNVSSMMDAAPSVRKGTTFVSVRALSKVLESDLSYSKASQMVTFRAQGSTITFWIGKNFANVDGNQVKLPASVYTSKGRTQVPLRFLAEQLGWNVQSNKDWSISMTKIM
jgi:hypothetical protein